MKKSKIKRNNAVHPKKGQPYIKSKAGLTKKGKQKWTKTRVYKKMPKGWKVKDGVMTNPYGFKMIDNGKSWVKGENKYAYIRDKSISDKDIKKNGGISKNGSSSYHSK